MVSTNDILNFASAHKVFTRKELIASLKSSNRISKSGTLSEQINRLLKSGQLVRIERGIYSLSDNAQKDFSVICTEEMKNINQQIKAQFPFVDYCLWSASTLMSYMHHIPNLNLVFVDVERDVAESVFNLLNTDSIKRVFLLLLIDLNDNKY
jgi:predicted transcriptional regulator of viral defense system